MSQIQASPFQTIKVVASVMICVPIILFALTLSGVVPIQVKEGSDIETIQVVFYGVAFFELVIGILFRKSILTPFKSTGDREKDKMKMNGVYSTSIIISFAMWISIGIFGFVLYYMGAQSAWYLPLFALSFFTMLIFSKRSIRKEH